MRQPIEKELIEALADTYPVIVRVGAADGLGYLGSWTATAKLLEILKSDQHPWELRNAAAKALGRIGRVDRDRDYDAKKLTS